MVELYNMSCDNLALIVGKRKICIVTDPPFNIKYRYNTYSDNMEEKQYYEWLSRIFLQRQCPFVIIHYPECLHKLSFYTGKFPEKICSWVYNSNNSKQHRDVAYYGITPDFNQVKQPYKNLNDKRIKKLIENGSSGSRLYDWWNINQVKNVSKEKTIHPCQMPIEVMKNIIGVLPKDYIIYDPFMGSGTTGVVCKELGYDFIGCEIDKEYFNVAKNRLDEMEQAVK